MLNQMSQKQKDKYHMISFTWDFTEVKYTTAVTRGCRAKQGGTEKG